MFRITLGLVLLACVAAAEPAFAANYPLEITAPRRDLPAAHRMLRAYPGIVYNIRAAVVGGAYPYTYTLSNAPAGMSINSQTGEITWPNPTASASNITVTVRDSENTQVHETWSVTVGTSGFKFVDAVNGSSSGTGTIGSPWRTLADVYNRGAGTDIVYFRSGTYTVSGIPTANSGLELRVEFDNENNQPITWLAYPGANPIIDHRYAGSPTPRIRLTGDIIYVDGFEVRNVYVMGFQVAPRGGHGPVFRRLNMHHLMVGGDGSNAALIMSVNVQQKAYGMVIQDSTFCDVRNLDDAAVTLKLYATDRLLIENTTHCRAYVALEVKESNTQFTVRGNTFFNITANAIGGNMADMYAQHLHTGEICFNNVRDSGLIGAVRVNQNGEAGRTYIYRNTLQGRVQVQNTDAADGPFYFSHNVIVNSDSGTPAGSHIYHSNVSAPSRVVLSNNLVGSPSQGIVDAEGNLTAAYAGYLGTHGHQLGATSGPRPPTNLRVIP